MNLDPVLVIELVNAVKEQLHYLDAPDQGKFDSGPTMLQRADARVRAAHRAIICPAQGSKCSEMTTEHLQDSSEHSATSSEHCETQHDLFRGTA